LTTDHDEKEKSNDIKENNIDDFFAQFDEISNKFENKPKETQPNEPGITKELDDANLDSDLITRIERLKSLNENDFFAKVIDKFIVVLIVVKEFFIKFASRFFLEKSELTNNKETGAGTSMARNSKRKKPKKYKINKGKLAKFMAAIILIFVLIIGAFTVSVVLTAPKIDPNNIYSLLSESSLLYDSEGNVIDSVVVGDGSRTNVAFSALPENLVNSFVAICPNFRCHF